MLPHNAPPVLLSSWSNSVVDDPFLETEIRLVATAGLNRARLNGPFRHGLAAGDRVNLSRPVGDAGRPLLP